MCSVRGASCHPFSEDIAMSFAGEERVPEKHLVSLRLETGSLYLGNVQSNWQHCSGTQRWYIEDTAEIIEQKR